MTFIFFCNGSRAGRAVYKRRRRGKTSQKLIVDCVNAGDGEDEIIEKGSV
ncbi:MAG: hypothetical protein L6V85_10390 [Clostridiales bacterium]|nr:MAG: hypothetical protein L6V85_10390 [Clostridiales bacterium]